MAKLSQTQEHAVEILSATGGILDYQAKLFGFALPGANRDDRIVMNTAKALVRLGVVKVTRTKHSHRGDLIDQITLAEICPEPEQIECHCCHSSGQMSHAMELPTGWGFVEDDDPYHPYGRGMYYACPDCKDEGIS